MRSSSSAELVPQSARGGVAQVQASLAEGTSSRSFEPESWSYVQHKDFHVHVLKKVEHTGKSRPTIPTTEAQRLSFLRAYTTSPFKQQIIYLQQMKYSTFFFIHVWNVMLRSIHTNYVQVFLSAFDPSKHLYAANMLPLVHGVTWQVILCSLLQLVASADILSMFMVYGLGWINNKTPWWTCPEKYYRLSPNPSPYRCYDLDTFRNICHSFRVAASSGQVVLSSNYYRWNLTGEHSSKKLLLTAAPIHHFMQTWTRTSIFEYKSYSWIICFAVIWISAGAFYKQLFTKYIWKLCHSFQILMNIIYLMALLYIEWTYLEVDVVDISRVYNEQRIDMAAQWDFDFLSEILSGPPVIHVLYSRCTQKLNPGRGSTQITISNSLMYFFKSLVDYRMKSYVESVYKAPIVMSLNTNPYPIFYFWPFFFKITAFGDFMLRVFYFFNFIAEFLIFVITYQIFVEVLVCEYSWLKRWLATALVSAAGLTLSVAFSTTTKSMAYVVTTALVGLTEVVVVCWVYPLGRLLDDVHYTRGAAVLAWRKWGLTLLPWYHIYKTFTMLQTFRHHEQVIKAKKSKNNLHNIMENTSAANWLWILAVVPLPLGVAYVVVKYIIIQKKNWRMMMKPLPEWGPREHVSRQLRKQFDSRQYVDSQAPRFLARHMLAKAQTPTYHLDICYSQSAPSRRSTALNDKRVTKQNEYYYLFGTKFR